MNTQTTFCTFSLGTLQLGVEVQRVQEVIRHQRMTRVPGAGDSVAGLMNLRGQIVTAIDLRQRLGLTPEAGQSAAMSVVLRTPDGPVSLLVDQIGDVALVDIAMFEPSPETLQGIARNMLQGAYKLENELLLILDADAVLKQAA